MSSAVRDILAEHRPRGFAGRGDKYLAEVAQGVRRLLVKNQQTLTYPTCRLTEHQLSQVAVLLVEFAEDIHNDIGLWRTLESFNGGLAENPASNPSAWSAMRKPDARLLPFPGKSVNVTVGSHMARWTQKIAVVRATSYMLLFFPERMFWSFLRRGDKAPISC